MAAAAGVVLVAVVATACGGGSQATAPAPATGSRANAPASVTLAAYRATVAAGSADVSTSVGEHTGDGYQLVLTDQGAFSWRSGLGQMTTDFKVDATDIQSSEIIDGHDEYIRMSVVGAPVSGSTLPGADLWSRTTWTGGSAWGLLNGLTFGSPGPPSPEALLHLLQSQATATADLGPASIGGVATTHYRSQLPVSSLGIDHAQVAQAEQSLGGTTIGVDFWVDPAGLLRRLSFALSLHKIPTEPGTTKSEDPGVRPPLTLTLTLDLSNYGVPVDVTPPPADQIDSGGSCQADSDGITCDESISGSASGSVSSSNG